MNPLSKKNACIILFIVVCTSSWCSVQDWSGRKQLPQDTTGLRKLIQKAEALRKSKAYEDAHTYEKNAFAMVQEGFMWEYLEIGFRLASISIRVSTEEEGNRLVTAMENRLRSTADIPDSAFLVFHRKAAHYFGQTAQIKKELEHREKALSEVETVYRSKKPVLPYLHPLAYSLVGNGRLDESEKYFEYAIQISQEAFGEQHRNTAGCYRSMVWYYNTISKPEKALEYAHLSKKTYQGLDDFKPEDVASIDLHLGLFYLRTEDYDLCLRHCNMARDVYEAMGDSNLLGQKKLSYIFSYMSGCYNSQFDFNNAIIYRIKAIDAIKNSYGADFPRLSKDYADMAGFFFKKEDSSSATHWLTLARDHLKQNLSGHPHIAGHTYIAMAKVYLTMEKYEQSKALANEALALFEGGASHNHEYALVPQQIVLMADLKMGNNEAALAMGLLSLKAIEGSEATKMTSIIQANIGSCYLAKEMPDSALLFLQKALVTHAEGFSNTKLQANPDPVFHSATPRIIQTLTNKARSLKLKFEQTKAPEYLVEASQVYEKIFDWCEYKRLRATSHQSKREVFQSSPKRYREGIALSYQLYEILGDSNYLSQAFEWTERSRAYLLRESLLMVNSAELSIPASYLHKERDLQLQISRLEEQGIKGSLKNLDARNLEILKDSFVSLRKRLQADYPSYYHVTSNYGSVALADVQNRIGQNERLLSYVKSDSSLTLFLIGKGVFKVYKTPIDSSFDQLISEYRKSLSDYRFIASEPQKAYETFVSSSYRLFSKLFPGDCLEHIRSHKLVIVPDAELHHVSFDALLMSMPEGADRDYRRLSYLGNQIPISYAPSATILKEMEAQQPRGIGYLGVAPSYDKDLLASIPAISTYRGFFDGPLVLEGAMSEIKSIGSIFEGDIITGNQATEDAFLNTAQGYQILHLAMHAIIDNENPLESKLIFAQERESISDNLLTTHEIYGMKLNAEMVVLSACNSGYGKVVDGEGQMSLARGFVYAGCPSVVMSQWKADDMATKELMVHFFKHLKEGLSKSEALQKAKQHYLSTADRPMAHPYFWANFSVIGSDKPIKTEDRTPWLLFIPIIGLPIALLRFRKYVSPSPGPS